jgi:hypothetical protein
MNDLPKQGKGGLTGKIARLPHTIREALNRRLMDGHPAAGILTWLNGFKPVQEILAAQFNGQPINKQNLSNWRHSGYQQWLEDNKIYNQLRRRSRYAARLARADRGIIHGAGAIVSDQILGWAESFTAQKPSPEELGKIVAVLAPLLRASHGKTRLRYEKRRLNLKDEHLTLLWDIHQRDVVAIGRRLLSDEQAKEIAQTPFNNAIQIELLGRRLFGKSWQGRPVPPEELPHAPNQSNSQAPVNTGQPESSAVNPGQATQ